MSKSSGATIPCRVVDGDSACVVDAEQTWGGQEARAEGLSVQLQGMTAVIKTLRAASDGDIASDVRISSSLCVLIAVGFPRRFLAKWKRISPQRSISFCIHIVLRFPRTRTSGARGEKGRGSLLSSALPQCVTADYGRRGDDAVWASNTVSEPITPVRACAEKC